MKTSFNFYRCVSYLCGQLSTLYAQSYKDVWHDHVLIMLC